VEIYNRAKHGGQVQTSTGPMEIAQLLNSAGENGGELTAMRIKNETRFLLPSPR
jgi:hypothetical protein